MYAGDYYNSWEYVEMSPFSTDSWLNICHGLSSGSPLCSKFHEWTMSKYGRYAHNYYGAWYVSYDGHLSYTNVDATWPVRPVFYLASTVGLIGFGTESSPYTITTIK